MLSRFGGRVGSAGREFASGSVACDSSSLISLADCCLLPILAHLKPCFAEEGDGGGRARGEFLISREVKRECIDQPLKLKSHTLPAVRLELALNDGLISVADARNLGGRTEEVLWVANNIFFENDKPVPIMHAGEAETLALALELGLKNIMIDERTLRFLVEKPEALRSHMAGEFRRDIRVNEKYLDRFRRTCAGLSLFRSSELVIIAFERGYFRRFGRLETRALEAALYGVKFAGCSISFEEIGEYAKGFGRERGRRAWKAE
ncbi:MAG: hypothetical protein PHF51_02560 [Candidatus ainarchaeum sp.]|nr:hypothetical protein [Candidatus ainarchaeum sp.]